MFHSILGTVVTNNFTILGVLVCTASSLVLGAVIAYVFNRGGRGSKNLALSLVLLPALVQIVIMMVNGNIGTGIAIMGAFSLVRFRSNPGKSTDICAVFFAMAVGLASGMGFLDFAATMTVIVCVVYLILTELIWKKEKETLLQLRITVPEQLNFEENFKEVFEKYLAKAELERAKTTNLGSMYELTYTVVLKQEGTRKEFIDALRCLNGNLPISLGKLVEDNSLL